MNRSSEEIEREVETARGNLDQTVEALKSKMSPGQMIDELTQALKGSGADTLVSNLGSQVKENPLALALIGAGVAWLMMGKKEGEADSTASAAHASTPLGGYAPSSPPADAGPDIGADLKHKASDLASKASETASGLASRVGDAASSAKDRIAEAAGHAMHQGQDLGGQAAQAGQKLQKTFMDTLEQEPLIVGALGVAVGVAIGASLPSTSFEDKTLGKVRDQVLEKGRAAAQQGVDMAHDAAESAYQGVQQAAQEQGLVGAEGGSLADKAEAVVRAGVDAAREHIDQSRAH